MPTVKYRAFERMLEQASAFSLKTIEGDMGKGYAKVYLHKLRKKGRVIELMKGWYSFRQNPYLITVPLGEAYVGLGTAAFLHGAWDQVPNIDVLTPRAPARIKVGEREIAGKKILIRRLDKRLYYGYETRQVDGDWIRVSDPEKTLIDLVYFNYPFLDEILPVLKGKIKREKLARYLKRLETIRGARKIRKALKEMTGETAAAKHR